MWLSYVMLYQAYVAQPRETTIAPGLDGEAMNHPSGMASAKGARPRHGPPKMPVVNTDTNRRSSETVGRQVRPMCPTFYLKWAVKP